MIYADTLQKGGFRVRTVTLSVTVTGPEEALNRLATTLGQNGFAWDVQPTERDPQPKGAVDIDTRSRRVLVDGREIETTKREFDLLLFFGKHAGAAVTRSQLMRSVWGHEHSGERTVDVYIRRLRGKLGRHKDSLTTVRGYGYRFTPGIIQVG
jgi:two-component system, OmpR family, response regulator